MVRVALRLQESRIVQGARFRFRVVAAIAAMASLAACSSSDPIGDRKDWDPDAASTVQSLAGDLDAKVAGGCTNLRPTNFATFAMSVRRAGFHEVPQAQASCDIGDESVEISAFRTDADRDAYVDDRTKVICRIALHPRDPSKTIKGFPGLRWVLGDGYTVQIDTQQTGRVVATALDGTYAGRPCDDDAQDWDAAAADRILELLRRLDHSDCPAPQLDNHDTARVQQFTRQTLPAASAACAADDSAVHIVEYGRQITDHAEYLRAQADYWCVRGGDTTAVSGPTWGAIAESAALAARVAAALGGTVDSRRCGGSNG